jgi:hypothetical protein
MRTLTASTTYAFPFQRTYKVRIPTDLSYIRNRHMAYLFLLLIQLLLKQTPWPESASEVYRPSDRRLSANICGQRMSRGQRGGSLRLYSRFSRPEPLLFLPSSSSIVLTRLSGPRSGPTTSQKIW